MVQGLSSCCLCKWLIPQPNPSLSPFSLPFYFWFCNFPSNMQPPRFFTICRFWMTHLHHRCSSCWEMHYWRRTWRPRDASWKSDQCCARMLPIRRTTTITFRYQLVNMNRGHGLCLQDVVMLNLGDDTVSDRSSLRPA